MSKSFGRRTSGNNKGNGGFSDHELACIRLHERAQDHRNHVAGAEVVSGLVHVYSKRGGIASWSWLLAATLRIERFNRAHAVHETCWPDFPFTSADIDRIGRYRAANPRE